LARSKRAPGSVNRDSVGSSAALKVVQSFEDVLPAPHRLLPALVASLSVQPWRVVVAPSLPRKVAWVWRNEGIAGLGRHAVDRASSQARASIKAIVVRGQGTRRGRRMVAQHDGPLKDIKRAWGGFHPHDDGKVTAEDMELPDVVEAQTADVFFYDYEPRRGDVVVDAGAGVGSELRVLAGLVGPTGRVVAVEAHPNTFARLEELRSVNHLANVTTVHAALMDSVGVVEITTRERSETNTVVEREASSVRVPAVTLDELLERLGVDRVDFLKMNIEGAEVNALKGFSRGLATTSHIAVACHDFRVAEGASESMRTKAGVFELLERAGLHVRRRSDSRPWIADYLYARRDADAS